MITLAITGHRPDKLNGYGRPAAKQLKRFAVQVMEVAARSTKGELQVMTGMAQGFDQAVAAACIELRIPFFAALPFEAQSSRWPAEAVEDYIKLLNKAAAMKVICPGPYAPWKNQVRNEFMVDNISPRFPLIALWNGSYGGTCTTINYAVKQTIEVVNVWDQYLEYFKLQAKP